MSEALQKIISDYIGFLDEAHVALSTVRRMTGDVPALSIEKVIELGLLLSKPAISSQEAVEIRFYVGLAELKGQVTALKRDDFDRLVSALWWANCKADRDKFRSRLGELMHSPERARERYLTDDIQLLTSEMLIITSLDTQGRPEIRYYPRTVEAAYRYVLVQIYRESKKLWKRLRKCPYCDSYFLRQASKLGGRPRDYCSAECQKKADQVKALARQKRQRKRNPK